MMEERYHATTQNRFYPDMFNVYKNISGGKTYQPTYVLSFVRISRLNWIGRVSRMDSKRKRSQSI